MLWKYQVYDSLSQTTDTVWFSITDTVTISSDEFVTEWREKRVVADYFGWSYLHCKGDTLEIFDDSVGVPARWDTATAHRLYGWCLPAFGFGG